MRSWQKVLRCSLVAAALLAPLPAFAQEDEAKPKPAARAPLVFGAEQDPNRNQDDAGSLQPDTRPLTGVQNSTLGTPGIRHSYWLPGFLYGNITRSSALYQPQTSDWNTSNYIVGNLSLLRAWSRAQLAMNYSGGGAFAPSSAGGNSQFHQFGLLQTFEWKTLQLVIIDQFSYLPETQFGFGGLTGLSNPGVGGSLGPSLPGLQNNYIPNQSIFTTFGPRYSNAFVSQATYLITPRASITAGGSYGILRFTEAGNIESNQVLGSLGFNYALSPTNTIGVLYRFSGYQFIGDPQAIGDHVGLIAFGRKLTARLALELFAGPDYTTFRIPIGTAKSRITGAGGAHLAYGLSRGRVSLTYNHGIAGGSGVFVGASIDQLGVNLSRQLAREWTGNLNFGYARNRVISGTSSSQSYNSWTAGAGISRPLGRDAAFALGYTAQVQTSNQAVCAAGTCGTNFTVHQITLGFEWHTRPYVLQ